MKIEHTAGTSVDTDKLPDVDATLMEESQKLHALFAKYNRQMFLVGEMIAREGMTATNGCVFFHVAPETASKDPDAFSKAINTYYGRIDGYVRSMSNNTLGIGRIPPPVVDSYPESSDS